MNPTMVAFNIIYLGLLAVGGVIFAIVFLSTRARARAESGELNVFAWKRRENAWLWIVIAALVAAVAATIFDTPWRAEAQSNRQTVTVEGVQFGFIFSEEKFTVGRQVEFVLTSKDTSHAFAVFDPDNVMLTQAQMMPGYDNRIYVTFTKPGTYTVLCFEYCGVGHHQMIHSFEVVPA